MEHARTASETCPIHRMYDSMRKSEIVRFMTVINLSSLRVARAFVDRRISRIEERERPMQEERVVIRVNAEPTRL